MLNFGNINDNMACFLSRIRRGRSNNWIKGLVYIGDYRNAMTRNTEGKMTKTPRKRTKKRILWQISD